MMMLVVAALMVVVVMMVFMVVVVAAAMFIIVIIVVMMFMLVSQTLKLCLQGIGALHSRQNLRAGNALPIGGDKLCVGVKIFDNLDRFGNALVRNSACMAEYYRRGVFYLVAEKLAEVFHIHFTAVSVYNRCKCI